MDSTESGSEDEPISLTQLVRRSSGAVRSASFVPFDVVIRGGRVLCPASGVDRTADVGIRDGHIAANRAPRAPRSPRSIGRCTCDRHIK